VAAKEDQEGNGKEKKDNGQTTNSQADKGGEEDNWEAAKEDVWHENRSSQEAINNCPHQGHN